MTPREERTIKYPWQSATLLAAREAIEPKLTQNELADRAGLDRSNYNQIERGNRRLSLRNVERLAPYLKREARELLEPGYDPVNPEDPVRLLGELGASVENQKVTIEALLTRVEALERGASKRRSASGGGR